MVDRFWLLPQPADWGLGVKLGRETEVEFYTYSPLFPERIFRHLDCYRNGNYRPDSQHQVEQSQEGGFKHRGLA